LPLAAKKRLYAIGFVWDSGERRQEKGFAALKNFKAREGHCLAYCDETGFKLGHWVNNQRNNKNKMSAERRVRLITGFNALNGRFAFLVGYIFLFNPDALTCDRNTSLPDQQIRTFCQELKVSITSPRSILDPG